MGGCSAPALSGSPLGAVVPGRRSLDGSDPLRSTPGARMGSDRSEATPPRFGPADRAEGLDRCFLTIGVVDDRGDLTPLEGLVSEQRTGERVERMAVLLEHLMGPDGLLVEDLSRSPGR